MTFAQIFLDHLKVGLILFFPHMLDDYCICKEKESKSIYQRDYQFY